MTGSLQIVPDALAARLSEVGRGWAESPTELLAEYALRWDVELGYALDLPARAFVVRGRRHGRPVVVKLWPSAAGARRERDVLIAASGRGYVHLLDADVERGVLLLEGLGSELAATDGGDGDARVASTVTATLLDAWSLPLDVVAPPAPGEHPAQLLAGAIEGFDRRNITADCHRALDRALAYAAQRLDDSDEAREVVVHGNPHAGNFRRVQEPREGAETGYVLVDPVGFRSDREYDLAVVLREGHRALMASDDPVVLARRWCARLAETTDTDAELIWQWSFLQRVAQGCELATGREPLIGRGYLQTACALIGRRAG